MAPRNLGDSALSSSTLLAATLDFDVSVRVPFLYVEWFKGYSDSWAIKYMSTIQCSSLYL